MENERVRVQKNGRLVVPRKAVEAAGLSPYDSVALKDIELTKKGRQRRAVIRWIAGAAVAAVAARVADVEGMLQFAKRIGVYDPDADQERLERLFGIKRNGSGVLIPAANHPFKDPPPGKLFYPTEAENCAAYRERFLGNVGLRIVKGFPQVKPDDSMVLFGSQVSNLNTRLLLGNPFGLENPRLDLVQEALGWRVRLRWNLYTPLDAAVIELQQFGAPWFTRNHAIGGSEGDTYQSRVRGKGLEDDYLLITTLPRFGRGSQKVIVFSGCHGPGQKAATLVLGGSATKQLVEVDKRLSGEPYYQALFHVDLARDAEGEFVPKNIQLIEATPLELQFGRA